MLLISRAVRQEIGAHAAAEYPRECCGILLGDRGNAGVVQEAIRSGNVAAAETRGRRYAVEPLAIVRAEKSGRARGLEIVGFYHSHPDHAAVPSVTDVSLAWAGYVYLIAAIAKDEVVELRGWRLSEAGDGMSEILLA